MHILKSEAEQLLRLVPLCRVCSKTRQQLVLQQQNMFLTFLCDINLRLIVGSALLIGLGDFCLHLSCSYTGKVKGSNVPPVLIPWL